MYKAFKKVGNRATKVLPSPVFILAIFPSFKTKLRLQLTEHQNGEDLKLKTKSCLLTKYIIT